MPSVVCDELDEWIVQSLQLDGRASFSRIGEVLGVSAQTVARRYRRLRAAQAVRVIGKPYLKVIGHAAWVLRIECTPDSAERIATALAARENTNWVRLTTGGGEIICGLRAAPQEEQQILATLPRTPRVVGFSAHCLLRRFRGGPAPWTGWTRPLGAEQIRELSGGRPDAPFAAADRAPDGRVVELDPVARKLLEVLGVDGRTPVSELAARAGISETAARRRLQELTDRGVLYFEVDIDTRAVGMNIEATVWLTVPPAALNATGSALARHPEVCFAAATTGRTSLLADVRCRDIDAFYAYLSESVGAIPHVTQAETAIHSRTLKRQIGLPPLRAQAAPVTRKAVATGRGR
ncbi:Lrp/AsnC family transcriptional regulator [Streptomyces sp. NPDC018031]|uniref:Lrp/AsnC family transcriptional regulator n=1 Tax=Streptomyces sp. NPDC018031 TaxID=3365033 RepID=UPI0037A7D226